MIAANRPQISLAQIRSWVRAAIEIVRPLQGLGDLHTLLEATDKAQTALLNEVAKPYDVPLFENRPCTLVGNQVHLYIDMKSVYNEREEFGALARKLRNDLGLSLRELQALTGVTYTMFSAIECGEKAVGSDVATKLADALNLTGDERDRFLMKAAGTRKKDRLLGISRTLAPELVNYVAKSLVGSGVVLDEIDSCQLRKNPKSKATRSQEDLVLGFKDGRSLVCGLIMEPA
jgi:transcriptional regulator with XRE-family HTH domain